VARGKIRPFKLTRGKIRSSTPFLDIVVHDEIARNILTLNRSDSGSRGSCFHGHNAGRVRLHSRWKVRIATVNQTTLLKEASSNI